MTFSIAAKGRGILASPVTMRAMYPPSGFTAAVISAANTAICTHPCQVTALTRGADQADAGADIPARPGERRDQQNHHQKIAHRFRLRLSSRQKIASASVGD